VELVQKVRAGFNRNQNMMPSVDQLTQADDEGYERDESTDKQQLWRTSVLEST
jgi:hypothetical protein